MARKIISGDPGTSWFNDTGIVHWQLECSLINTCGSCFQWHMQVAEYWACPLHRCCRCRTLIVPPGEYARPFADYRKLIANLDESQHDAAVGKANYRLIEAGVVKWADVVTSARVRALHEVVAREHLTVDKMVKAGVDRKQAEEAWAMVHTPAHEAFTAKIKQAASALRNAGLSDDQIVHGFAERLSPRITGIEKVPTITGKVVVPAGQKIDWEGSRITGGPAKEIIAGNTILERIRRGQSEDPVRMPDFQGSVSAMWQWVAETFPKTYESLSKEDWAVLVLAVEQQEKLKKVFVGLGIDPEKALKAIK